VRSELKLSGSSQLYLAYATFENEYLRMVHCDEASLIVKGEEMRGATTLTERRPTPGNRVKIDRDSILRFKCLVFQFLRFNALAIRVISKAE
jgi:hypothetical protein